MRTPALALAAATAAALAIAPPAAGQRPVPQFHEAEDLLPALESAVTTVPPTPGQAVARREVLDPLASGNAFVRFDNEWEGNRFTLRFPVLASGTYTLVLRATRGPDHGVVRYAVDGRRRGPRVDLAATRLRRAATLRLRRLALAEGAHTLTVFVARRSAGLDAGLDYLELLPERRRRR